MYESLLQTLPEAARACRALYEPASGGYHLPLRESNRLPTLADVPRWRAEYPRVLYDCIETPVADLLYALVVNTRSRRVLETGTSRGFSTCHLAAGAQVGAPGEALVVTIDVDPAPSPFFEGSDLARCIVARRENSLQVDPRTLSADGGELDFMFFDSLHTYAHLAAELAHFLPVLRLGGLFALHDTFVFDDLGLVVLATAGSGRVEMLSLPTHRRHAEPARSPGVSLFRKIAPIAPGDLRFPDLRGVLEGEQHWLSDPRGVVARTGRLFLDHRYTACRLPHDAREPLAPALLDPLASERPAARAEAAAPAAPRRPPSHPPGVLARQAEWWRAHGANHERCVVAPPAALQPPSQRRCLDGIAAQLAGCRRVVVVGPSTGWLAQRLRQMLGPAGATDVQAVEAFDALPRADGYAVWGALQHLGGSAIDAALHALTQAAEPHARVALVEPVCFPLHGADARDRALFETVDELLAEPAAAAARQGITSSATSQALRRSLQQQWWGTLPLGPAPTQKPFEHDELATRLHAAVAIGTQQIVQCMRASVQLGTELALLALDAPALAARLAAELHPPMDALERSLLRKPRLPDLSWYQCLVCGVVRAPLADVNSGQ